MGRTWSLALVLVSVCTLASPAHGDRSEAEALGAQAERALRGGKPAEAAALYERAAAADPSWLPAVAGMGRALLADRRTGPGLEHLRRFVEAVEDDPAAARRHDDLLADTRKLLRRKDAGGKKLARLIESHAAACATLADSWRRTDMAAAHLAWREGNALQPDLPALGRLTWQLGELPEGEALLPQADASGWLWIEAPRWVHADGILAGTGTDVWSICRTQRRFHGNYDIRCEARVTKGGGSAVFLMQATWRTTSQNISFGMRGSDVLLLEGFELPTTADPPSGRARKTGTRVDPKQWNLFELRFRPRAVFAYVNGERVGVVERGPLYGMGHLALTALLGRIEYRRVAYVAR